MREYLFIIVIMFLTIICTISIHNHFINKNEFILTFYQTCTKDTNISETISVEDKNLKVTLKGFYSDILSKEKISNIGLDEGTINNILKYSNDNKYNLLVEFSSIDGSVITEPIFNTVIYDNLGNVISSIHYNREFPKENQFLKYFIKKHYNSDNIQEINNHSIGILENKVIVNSSDTSKLILESINTSNKNNKTFDLSKIHILIINPNYKNAENNRIYLDDTIFEYILEK